MEHVYLAFTKFLANLCVGLSFALIALILIGLIAGRDGMLDGYVEIALCVLNAIGWMIVSRKDR